MMKLQELSRLVGGNLTSHADLKISGAASIARASETEITFACSDKHFLQFQQSSAAAAVIPKGKREGWLNSIQSEIDKPCIEVDLVEDAFIKIAESFKPPIVRTPVGISPLAVVSSTAKIEDDVCIHPGAVIMDNVIIGCGSVVFPNVTIMENCRIGSHVKIFPGAVLYENTEVRDRVIIHANSVLGAYGFGYNTISGSHKLSPQLGYVRIESDVEIGAASTIDRSTYDTTTIGEGT